MNLLIGTSTYRINLIAIYTGLLYQSFPDLCKVLFPQNKSKESPLRIMKIFDNNTKFYPNIL